MIKVYTGLKGFAVSFFFIAGLILFSSIVIWGFTKVIELLLPLLIVGSYLLIIIFALGFLPATLLKDMRPTLGAYSVLMSHALGVSTWMLSFIFVMKAFGFLGIFFVFLFHFLTPIAIVGAMLKGSWHIAGHLIIWTGFIYGMRFYSQWLQNLDHRDQNKGDIIDVDAVEVQ